MRVISQALHIVILSAFVSSRVSLALSLSNSNVALEDTEDNRDGQLKKGEKQEAKSNTERESQTRVVRRDVSRANYVVQNQRTNVHAAKIARKQEL